MSSLSVPGAVIDFDLSGEDTTGPAVVQLHGLTSSRARDRVLGLDLGRAFPGRLLRYDALWQAKVKDRFKYPSFVACQTHV